MYMHHSLIVITYFCYLYEVVLSRVRFSFFFQAEDGIRYLVRSRGLGDVYKRQIMDLKERLRTDLTAAMRGNDTQRRDVLRMVLAAVKQIEICLLYTSPSPRDRTRSRMPSSA